MIKKFWPFFILILIVAIIFAYKSYNKPHKEADSTQPDVIMTPVELMAAYDADETAANIKYLDKLIQLKGKVKQINQLTTGASLTLDAGQEMAAVICEFQEGDALKGVQEDQEITLNGFCTGKLMDIVLVRCSISDSK